MLRNLLFKKRTEALAEAGVAKSPVQPAPESLADRKKSAEGQIDDFMRKIGYSDPSSRTDEHGRRWFQLGSAEGWARVIESDGDLFLRAEAFVMPLPSDKDLILPLMRELLEINAIVPGAGRVGIENDFVIASSTRPVSDLHPDDFAQCIHSAMYLADSLDDDLLKKYGGTSKTRVAKSTASTKSSTKSPKKKAK